jgi:hypothetical protein
VDELTHAVLRLIDGFTLDQMVSQYRALRFRLSGEKHQGEGLGKSAEDGTGSQTNELRAAEGDSPPSGRNCSKS